MAETPAHLRDQKADDQCGDGIENGIARKIASDAQADHQRGCGVRACMPGICDQHARFHLLGGLEHIAE